MYDPKGNGRDKAAETVRFAEAAPPPHLRHIVHRFLEIRTSTPLREDYRFHALPDACTYAVFDQINPKIAGITCLNATSEEFNLGREFHFVNIRFYPGVWHRSVEPTSYGQVKTAYQGQLSLTQTNKRLRTGDFKAKQDMLVGFVEALTRSGHVVENRIAERILHHIDEIHSVADMADLCALSSRQLQRVLKQTTGFRPHDFLKILRLQLSLRDEPSLSYADQSHFIHSFRNATGYTPGRYARKFDV
ncbi:AraC family transcriptional regulator [Paracoccus albus]|uniref:AraC family transcriptional regulator n=1 Tax=Paracoccus albus TaxID=3017784 RepID=UPI0022F13FF9|nr:AraC family transcriptional regulator [Paracoccus albus]WBU59188.1 AraC family transcriptional regulator [Paracoccus albus]